MPDQQRREKKWGREDSEGRGGSREAQGRGRDTEAYPSAKIVHKHEPLKYVC